MIEPPPPHEINREVHRLFDVIESAQKQIAALQALCNHRLRRFDHEQKCDTCGLSRPLPTGGER